VIRRILVSVQYHLSIISRDVLLFVVIPNKKKSIRVSFPSNRFIRLRDILILLRHFLKYLKKKLIFSSFYKFCVLLFETDDWLNTLITLVGIFEPVKSKYLLIIYSQKCAFARPLMFEMLNHQAKQS